MSNPSGDIPDPEPRTLSQFADALALVLFVQDTAGVDTTYMRGMVRAHGPLEAVQRYLFDDTRQARQYARDVHMHGAPPVEVLVIGGER
jgi:hypothetical protein